MTVVCLCVCLSDIDSTRIVFLPTIAHPTHWAIFCYRQLTAAVS